MTEGASAAADKYADYSREQLLAEISRLKKSKKYGLVWEHKVEDVIQNFETWRPYLEEVAEKRIENAPDEPTNLIIEGDNFEALSVLNYTHAGKVDVIYIDPPYNTGNKDFIYNDNYVDSEDAFRHSKWLSFMEPRLKLAKSLLKDDGVIFISIDDNEQAALKMLCDAIFGEDNFVANCFILDNLKGKTNDSFITSVGSRLYVYLKNRQACADSGFSKIENIFASKIENKYTEQDERGFFNGITFKKTGQSKRREDRPYMFYPILEKDGILYAISDDEFAHIYNKEEHKFDDAYLEKLREKYSSYNFILPTDSNGCYLRWTSGFNTFKLRLNRDIYFDKNSVKQKSRPEATEMLQEYSSSVPKSFMYKPAYSSGTQDLQIISNNLTFDYPKPIELLKDIAKMANKGSNSIILDFFAGSGTTGQAVLELNKEDGGRRQFILCTNNGDKGPDSTKIAEEITYPRVKTVITGVRQDGSKYSDGIPANLRYYKIDHREKKQSLDANRQDFAYYIDDIIQVKENAFKQIVTEEDYALYAAKDKYVATVTEPFALEEIVKRIAEINANKLPLKLYVFSYSRDAFEENFDVDFDIEFAAMPEGLLKTYANIVAEQKKEDL